MKRTISVMLGKGSSSHNSRKFKAANVDAKRSSQNITYYDKPLRDVYHDLFDDALQRYNQKQKRSDRKIENYYEKIRTGKQEKLFHEVILQIGNKDNMSAISEDGQVAAKVLDNYMKAFERRNPNLYVFSAHLHMDEATPHLHIDFVPFVTGSKRGLDTRVSLKQALASQGFTGGTRGETEWNQWVYSEKEQLSREMERQGIQWQQLGTHDEHLSVMNYKKEKRAEEVAELGEIISERKDELRSIVEKTAAQQSEHEILTEKLNKVQRRLKLIKSKEKFVAKNVRHYDDAPEFQLPLPKPMMSAKAYYERIAAPLVATLKDVIRGILLEFFEKTKELKAALERASSQVQALTQRLSSYEAELIMLRETKKDYQRLRGFLGENVADKAIEKAKIREQESYLKKESVEQIK